MCAPSAPAAPNPVTTAQAQTASNIDTAKAQATLNNVNQVTPYGNLTYTQTGTDSNGVPQYTATTTLSPAQQQLLNTNQQTQQSLATTGQQQAAKIGQLLSTPMDTSSAPAAGSTSGIQMSLGGDNGLAARDQAEQALMARLNPQLDQQQQALDAKLANQGIQLGSAAYDRAMQDFGQQRNDATLAAITQAGQEQALQQGLTLNAANFGNSAQSQAFNEANTNRANALSEDYAARDQPINEITSLLSGSQVGSPNFVSTPQTGVAGTDVAGITQNAFNAANSEYQTQMAQNNSILGGLFGLGASAIKLSDRRAKEDIQQEGRLPDGTKVYSYRYKPGMLLGTGRQIGVMAQEVEKTHPAAVVDDPSGLKKVDYSRLMAEALMKRKAA